MAVLSDISARVLATVNRDATYQGFFTPTKVTNAINDCMDYIVDCMMSEGQGWFVKRGTIDTTSGQGVIPLPTGCVLINNLWALNNLVYQPLRYNDDSQTPLVTSTVTVQWPSFYNIIGNNIVFNPIPSQFGTAFLQIDYTKFQVDLTDGTDSVDATFDKAMLNYIVWRASSILVAQVGKSYPDWKRYEDEWSERLRIKVSKRIREPTFIRGFRFE